MSDARTYHLRGGEEGSTLCHASSTRLAQSVRFADCVECLRLHVNDLERQIVAPIHRLNMNGWTRCGLFAATGSSEVASVTCPRCLRVLLEERTKQNEANHQAQVDAARRLNRLKRTLRSLLQADDRGENLTDTWRLAQAEAAQYCRDLSAQWEPVPLVPQGVASQMRQELRDALAGTTPTEGGDAV